MSTSKSHKPAHGGYPGVVRTSEDRSLRPVADPDTCLNQFGHVCRAGGYVHLAKFHDRAAAHGQAKTAEAMSR